MSKRSDEGQVGRTLHYDDYDADVGNNAAGRFGRQGKTLKLIIANRAGHSLCKFCAGCCSCCGDWTIKDETRCLAGG